jgi:hypothetical protein
VWVVRHGERVDEVPGVRWDKCGKTNPQWFDPALTGLGHQHAAGVADALRGKFGPECPFDVIYTSPLVRTVQTAEKFSEVPTPPAPLRAWRLRAWRLRAPGRPATVHALHGACIRALRCSAIAGPCAATGAGARSQRSGRVSFIWLSALHPFLCPAWLSALHPFLCPA